jgi:NADH-quinone oxidoreductase subunit J
VNSALALVFHMLSVAGLYLLLRAQFLAVIQVLVYAGAIVVLFLFVIMLLNLEQEERVFSAFSFKYAFAFLAGIAVLAQLLYAIGGWTGVLPEFADQMIAIGTVEAIGDELFTTYLLPFEVTAILLTAAVVGALLIAQRKIKMTDP